MRRTRNLLLTIIAVLLFALFLDRAPLLLNGYWQRILNLIAINAILALSLNLIYGITGMFSLGHAGFMAIGAYVSALLDNSCGNRRGILRASCCAACA